MKFLVLLALLFVGVFANDYQNLDNEFSEGTLDAVLIEEDADSEEAVEAEEEEEEEEQEEEEEEGEGESFVEIGGQAMSEPDTLKLIFDQIQQMQSTLASAKTTFGVQPTITPTPTPQPQPYVHQSNPQGFKKVYVPSSPAVPTMELQDSLKAVIAAAMPPVVPTSVASATGAAGPAAAVGLAGPAPSTSFLNPKEQGSMSTLDRRIRKYEARVVAETQNGRNRVLDDITSRLATLANTVDSLRKATTEQAELAKKLLAAAAMVTEDPAPKPAPKVAVRQPPAPAAWPNGKPKKAGKSVKKGKGNGKGKGKGKKGQGKKEVKKAGKTGKQNAEQKTTVAEKKQTSTKKQQQQNQQGSYDKLDNNGAANTVNAKDSSAAAKTTPSPTSTSTSASPAANKNTNTPSPAVTPRRPRRRYSQKQLADARAANQGEAPLQLQRTTVVPVDENTLAITNGFEQKVKQILDVVRREARRIYKKTCKVRKPRNPNARPTSYPKAKVVSPTGVSAVKKRKNAAPRGRAPKSVSISTPVDKKDKKTQTLAKKAKAVAAKAAALAKRKPAKFRPLIRGKEPIPRSVKRIHDLSNVLNALPVKPAYIANGPDMVADVMNQAKNLPTFD